MGTLIDEIGNVDFTGLFNALFQGGWFEYVFPFLLVYAIVLTILNNVDLFKEKKAVRVIISFVMALFAIAFPINGDFASCGVNSSIYNYGGCETLGSLMMSLFPGVTAFSIAILALYIIAAMLGVDLMSFFGENADENKILKYVLGGIGVLVVVYYFSRGFGWEGFDNMGYLDWLLGPNGLLRDPMVYILLIVGLLFWWITSDDDSPKSSKKDKKGTTIKLEE